MKIPFSVTKTELIVKVDEFSLIMIKQILSEARFLNILLHLRHW